MQQNYSKMLLLFNSILIFIVKCIIICMFESLFLQFSKKTKLAAGTTCCERQHISVVYVISTMTSFYLATDGLEFEINCSLYKY